MGNTYTVAVRTGDQTKSYSEAFQTETQYAAGWRRVLQAARDHGEVRCMCLGTGDRLLAVRYYETTDSFGLARYPNTGETHQRDCRFYAPNSHKSGLSTYQKGVVDERPDGTVKVSLAIGMTMKAPIPAVDAETELVSNGLRSSQRSMQLLGLLHFLWDSAGLNVWWPAMRGKRTVRTVTYRLNEAAENILVGPSKLSEVLLTPAYSVSGRDALRNIERVSAAVSNRSRLIVIATMAAYKEEPRILRVSGFHGIPFLDVTAAMWKSAVRRFPSAVAAWRSGQQVMVIAQCEPNPQSKVAHVVGLALMQVSSSWVPVESSYELVIADKLVAEERAFLKPLRYDAGQAAVHPDFILLDTKVEAPMEVFGRTDEAYTSRMQEKIDYFNQHFGQKSWWCWNAAEDREGHAIPDFPEKVRRDR